MAFAPKVNPEIAISVYVENAGPGGRWAAPIASLLLEKYLNDTLHNPAREKRIMAAADPFPDAPQ
jgi:penicillin-binding protein 2